ncbi:MAG: HYR domain-containing protein [Bacteroidia bacterium]|nr:HYR domain-containing protein [Bacteroidia bacterium]
MKYNYLTSFILLILCAAFPFTSLKASHFVGADLTYNCLSGNTYEITLNLYRDCAGGGFPNSWNINIASASCGVNNSATVTLVSSQEVSAICIPQIGNTSCSGGNLPGIQQYIYRTTYTLPQACSDWVFSFSSCCRNYAITTGPGGNSFYVQSKLNNLLAPCNSSPVFSSLPVPYFCAGQLANYNHGAIEPDGDSLVYSLVNPLQTAATSVTFNFPFTSTYPIATNPANNFGFNNLTGQMTFTPSGVQQGVLAVRVDEYRNGVIIGSVMRDIQVVVINCINNSSVQLQPISNLSGGTAIGANNLRVCAGNTLGFNIVGTDPNVSTTITMTSNAGVALPGSTFTTTGTNPVTGTFTWPTNASNVGYWNFTVTVTDNNCPVPSVQVIGFTINVFGVDISASDYTFCPGTPQNVQLNASVGGSVGCPSGNCYSWSPATGLSATNIPNPVATVSSPITYTVTYNDGVCTVIDQVAFVPEGSVTITPANPTVCPGNNVQLSATNTFPVQSGTCATSNVPCNGPVVLRSIGTGNTFNNTQFTSVTPYNGYWHDSRFQMLIRASELTAAGFVPGLLRSLSFNIGAKYSNQNYQNFNIKLACTPLTTISAFQNTGFSTVYTGTVGTIAGINTYNFTNPYQWDGVSNIIIEVCYDNTSYYRSDPVYYTTTTFNSVIYTYGDNNTGCSMVGGTISAARPNISINNCPVAPPVNYTWTSIAGNPVSTLSATNIANPVANPTQTTTYVVACDNGNCTVYDTVTVNMSPVPVLNSIPDINSCPGVPVTLTASGTGLLGYNWSTGSLNASITVSPMTTTTYFVTVNTACGNLSDTVTVFINDVTAPVISNCPASVTVNNDPGQCGALVSWVAPSVSDNCPNPVIVQSSGPGSGTLFPIGSTIISYSAIDVAGNTAVCSFTITVNDTENPVISGCPANIALSNDPGLCGAVVNWALPSASDNCSVVLSQTQGSASGSVFPLGTSTIEYTATDPSGNSVVCSFTITINDTENPVITGCPANINQGSDPGVCGAVINWTTPSVNDNCPGTVLTQTQGQASGSIFPLGTQTIEYTATDANGNTATCQFTVTVTDNLPPSAICQDITVSLDNTGNVSITAAQIDNGSTDNCGIQSISASVTAFDCSNVGVNVVTLTVTDVNGNTATCNANVTVQDDMTPNVVCQNITVQLDNTGNASITPAQVDNGSTDNCGIATMSVSPNGFDCSVIGANTVTLLVTDVNGNTANCTATVTVEDNVAPVAVCQDITIQLDNTGNAAITAAQIDNGSADACGIASVTVSPNTFNCSTAGVNVVILTVTDVNGNISTCNANVTVQELIPPAVICQDITVQLDATGNIIITPAQVDNGSTDNCGITGMSVSPNAFDCSNIGVNIVTLTASDANGNTATCNANVTVQDNTPPSMICQNLTVQLDNTGNVSITAAQVDNGSSDACGISGLSLTPTGFTCANIGANTVTLTATDVNGNTASCSATVTVQDNVVPNALCQNLTVQLDNTGNASITAAQIDNGSNDNCGVAGISVSPNQFTCANLGNNTVTLTVTDVNGNTATCNATVTIQDLIAPVLSGCPSNISQNNDSGLCGASVTWTLPTVSDNCPAVLSSTHNPGDFFALGSTTVTYTATDASGNTATCSFSVTISDNENPVIVNCPSNISANANANCQAVVNWTAPAFTDNCPGGTLSSSILSGSTFALGTSTVVYTATDAAGNTTTCSFDVTVTDNTPPVIVNCPANIVQNAGPNCDAVVNWTAPSVTDNCPGASVSGSHTPGSVFSFGTTTVVYTATDAAGNTATCSFDVTLQDNLPPVINNCPGNIVINLSSRCDTTVSWTPPTITDNCSGVVISVSDNPGDVFPLGVTNVTYTATDVVGNTASCAFTITVNPPPALNATITQQTNASCFGQTGSATVSVTGGSGSYLYSWTASGGQNTATATLGGGNHTVIVIDALANACVAMDTAQVNIVVPSLLSLNTTKTDPTCFGFSNGSATAITNGGTLPYSYTWNTSPVQSTSVINGLTAGTYTVIVNDANNCSQTKSVTLTEPDSLSATTSQLNVKCFGENTGKAALIVSGGTNPYNYLWTGSTSGTNSASNLISGNYSVTVTDGNGCSIVRNYTITQPAAPLSVTPSHTDALCFGALSGTATVTPNGGTAPYTYTWHTLTPDAYTQSVTGIKAGNYLVTVRDQNLCNEVLTITVGEPARLRLQIADINPPYCDLPNGSASVAATGGTFPYAYTWNSAPPQTGQMMLDVPAGDYTAYVQDGNGCIDSVNMTLNNTPPAQPLFISEPLNAQPVLLQNATIQFINQSIGASSYAWSFGDGFASGEENPVHTYTNPGVYNVTLIANNSYGACPVSYTLTYEIIPDGDIYIPNVFTPNGDGANDVFGATGTGVSVFEMQIFNRWGTIVKTMSSIADTWDGKDKNGTDVQEGVYVYKLFIRLNDGRTLDKGGSVTLIR